MKFDMGDVVVVPGVGVGSVESIETIPVSGEQSRAYAIDHGERCRSWVPTDQVSALGIRKPMSADEVPDTYAMIRAARAPKKRAHWNRRRRRYMEQVQSHDPEDLARLVGELVAVREKKKEKRQVLSFDERRILTKAKNLLVQEIAAATGRGEEAVAERLQKVIDEAV